MNIPHLIIPNSSVTVSVPGQTLVADVTHKNFNEILKTLFSVDGTVEKLKELFALDHALKNYLKLSDKMTVRSGAVYFGDEPVHNYTTEKILQFLEANIPVEPLVKFCERLQANPSRRAVQELYRFLEAKSMPITSDGFFRAYKGVRSDYKDIHSGKFDNSVGQVLSMARNGVDDDANVGCSYGFHAGTQAYANDWANANGHLMVVEIDPADVVSVPFDCNCQKLRTCKYVVVDELKDRGIIQDVYVDTQPDDDSYEFEYCDECGDEIDETGNCNCY